MKARLHRWWPLCALLYSLTAFAGQASLSWTAPTRNTDGSPLTDLTGYNVFRSCGAPTPLAQIAHLSAQAYIDSGIPDDGRTCWYAISTTATSGESLRSNTVSKTFALGLPGQTLSNFTWRTSPVLGGGGVSTTLGSDDFNRANGGIGSNWGGPNTISFSVVSNQLQGPLGADAGVIYTAVGSVNDAHWAQFTIVHIENSGGGGAGLCIWLRGSTSDVHSGYWVDFDGNGSVTVYQWPNTSTANSVGSVGSLGTLAGATVLAEITDPDANTVRIKVYVNGSLVLTADDTTATRITGSTAGPGIAFSASYAAYPVFDDYSFGDFSGGSTTTPPDTVVVNQAVSRAANF